MTYNEAKAAVESLEFDDMVKLRREMATMIFFAARKYQQASCTHPKVNRYEERRGNRSVDVRCSLCGVLVEYRE